MGDKINPSPSSGKGRVVGSVLIGILLVTGVGLFWHGPPLYATEPDKAAPASAGIINDWLRERSSAAFHWDLGGQFRMRYEAKNAGSFPNRDFARNLERDNDYLLLRTKLHLGWSPSKWLSLYLEGRDSRDIGDARTAPEKDPLDLHQAFVRLGSPDVFPLSLKIGRQELIYGDQHYVGNSDWSNAGRAFDAVKVRYESGGFWLDAFTGRLVLAQADRFNNANHYDWFSGLYASTRRLVSWQESDLFILASNVSGQSPAAGGQKPRDVYTVGTRWKSLPGKLNNWDYSLELAGQFGSIPQNGRRLDHRAYSVNVGGGHTWKNAFGAPRLGGGYDYGSGDGDPTDHRNGTFQNLFGTNHRFYGNMDLVGIRNMHIPRMEVSLRPTKKLAASAEWLGFWLADTGDFLYPETSAGRSQNGYRRNPGYSSHVGQEIDLLADWKIADWAQMRLGYGHFFAGAYVRRSIDSVPSNGGSVGADWFYTQYSINF